MTTILTPHPKVVFYHVKDNQAKLSLICHLAVQAFRNEKKLLITVNSLQAAQYVDQLLWRLPMHEFIPHAIADISSSEWITITLQDQHNVNKANCLLNLGTHFPPLSLKMEEVYEIYDETHADKLTLSKQRIDAYQAKGMIVKNVQTIS